MIYGLNRTDMTYLRLKQLALILGYDDYTGTAHVRILTVFIRSSQAREFVSHGEIKLIL